MTPNVVCAHTIYLHEDENWTYLCGDESNISRGMHIKNSGSARDLSSLTHSSQFPSSPISPRFSPVFPPFFPVFPRFPPFSPRFSPFFLHLYPLTYVTDFPLFDPLVKNPLLYPTPNRRLVAYCSQILGTLDPCPLGRGAGHVPGWGVGQRCTAPTGRGRAPVMGCTAPMGHCAGAPIVCDMRSQESRKRNDRTVHVSECSAMRLVVCAVGQRHRPAAARKPFARGGGGGD